MMVASKQWWIYYTFVTHLWSLKDDVSAPMPSWDFVCWLLIKKIKDLTIPWTTSHVISSLSLNLLYLLLALIFIHHHHSAWLLMLWCWKYTQIRHYHFPCRLLKLFEDNFSREWKKKIIEFDWIEGEENEANVMRKYSTGNFFDRFACDFCRK